MSDTEDNQHIFLQEQTSTMPLMEIYSNFMLLEESVYTLLPLSNSTTHVLLTYRCFFSDVSSAKSTFKASHYKQLAPIVALSNKDTPFPALHVECSTMTTTIICAHRATLYNIYNHTHTHTLHVLSPL